MGKRVGRNSGTSSPWTPIIEMGENTSATVWGVGIHGKARCSDSLLEPPRPALCHIPPVPTAPLPTPATLGSANSCQAPFLQEASFFFSLSLSLQDPEPETDGTRVGHGLKHRKVAWQEHEAEMRLTHVGACHDTPCT